MNIIEMAKQAGLQTDKAGVWVDDGYIDDELERFADLVAAHEREACAKMFDNQNIWDEEVAIAIRARGTT